MNIRLIESPDLASLPERWQELEKRADGSFFQSWIWTGCLLKERFTAPLLVEATCNGELVALALFNRKTAGRNSDTLFLGESGIPTLDAIFIEHNGPVISEKFGDLLLSACLGPLLSSTGILRGGRRRLVLSGVRENLLDAARRIGAAVAIRQTLVAPVVDLSRIRASNKPLLDHVSGNTRYQIRRAERLYEKSGPLTLRRAENATESHRMLDALASLHQRTWESRGRPGAFANPDFTRFHHALIDRAMPSHAVDLLEVSAGKRIIGFLLNFVWRGHVYAYQSGLDYALVHRNEKPGLVCHHQAINMYLTEGLRSYDFLAKADRYKTSFTQEGVTLYWAVVAPRSSRAGIMMRIRNLVSRKAG